MLANPIIDWPPNDPRTHPPRRRCRFLLILAIFAGVFFGCRAALSYYVDVLWFRSLGYGDVFWKTLCLQWGVFAAIAAASFLILYGSFLALKRAHLSDLPSGNTILIGGRPVKLPVESVLRLITLGVSLAIAAAVGAVMMSEWPALPLFWIVFIEKSCFHRQTYTCEPLRPVLFPRRIQTALEQPRRRCERASLYLQRRRRKVPKPHWPPDVVR